MRSRMRRRSDLEHGLARSAAADAAGEPRQPGVLLGQARQRVLELRQLDLQLAVAASGALREDVEDELGAVDGLRARWRPRSARACAGRRSMSKIATAAPHRIAVEHDLDAACPCRPRCAGEPARRVCARCRRPSTSAERDQLEHLVESARRRDDADHQRALARLLSRAPARPVAPSPLPGRAMVSSKSKSSWCTCGALTRTKGSAPAVRRTTRSRRGRGRRSRPRPDRPPRRPATAATRSSRSRARSLRSSRGERLAAQMGVHQAQAAKAADAAAQAPDVGQRRAATRRRRPPGAPRRRARAGRPPVARSRARPPSGDAPARASPPRRWGLAAGRSAPELCVVRL